MGSDSFDVTVSAKPAAGRDNWRFDFGDGFISADFVVGPSTVTVVPEGGFAGEYRCWAVCKFASMVPDAGSPVKPCEFVLAAVLSSRGKLHL